MKKHKKKDLFHDQKNGKPSSGVKKTYYFSEKNPLEIIGVKSRAHYKNGRLHGYKDNFTIKGKFRNGKIFGLEYLSTKYPEKNNVETDVIE